MSYQLAVIRLLLQACASDGLPTDVAELIDSVARRCDGWMAYKIGRQAARFSHHSLATTIFAQLTLAVSILVLRVLSITESTSELVNEINGIINSDKCSR